MSPKRQKAAATASSGESAAHSSTASAGHSTSSKNSSGAASSTIYKKPQFTPRLIQGFPTLTTVAIGNEHKLQVITSFNDIVSQLNLIAHSNYLQLAVFLNKYRAHCEDILQLVLQAKFASIEHLLLQFWPREREALVLLLNAHPVPHVVRLCDLLFFKTMISKRVDLLLL